MSSHTGCGEVRWVGGSRHMRAYSDSCQDHLLQTYHAGMMNNCEKQRQLLEHWSQSSETPLCLDNFAPALLHPKAAEAGKWFRILCTKLSEGLLTDNYTITLVVFLTATGAQVNWSAHYSHLLFNFYKMLHLLWHIFSKAHCPLNKRALSLLLGLYRT